MWRSLNRTTVPVTPTPNLTIRHPRLPALDIPFIIIPNEMGEFGGLTTDIEAYFRISKCFKVHI